MGRAQTLVDDARLLLFLLWRALCSRGCLIELVLVVGAAGRVRSLFLDWLGHGVHGLIEMGEHAPGERCSWLGR
jgi:hypothetical protein